MTNLLIRRFREQDLPLLQLADEFVCAAGAIYASEAGPRAAADMLQRAAAAIEEQLRS
jgi:hypothetical protein